MIASILFIVLLLFCPSKKSCLCEERHVTDIVKFVMALVVVNGHCWAFYMPESWWQGQFNYGAECVSVFLFFSAYGLMCAYRIKGNGYLKGFVRQRIGRVLFPFLTAYALTLPVYSISKGAIDWYEVLTTIWWGGPYMKFSWFVTEIVVLYLVFYICGKIDARYGNDGKLLVVLLTTAVIGLAAVFFVTHQPVWYINGLPCFVLGLWYQRYEDRILNLFQDYRGNILIGVLVLLFIIVFQWKDFSTLINVFTQFRFEYVSLYVANLLFVVLVIFLANNRQLIDKMPPSVWQKAISASYEIYLIQNACMIACDSLIAQRGMFIICTLVTSIVMGFGLKQLNQKIQKYIL